jgi:hypothetical protein
MTNAMTLTDWTWTLTTERDAHAPSRKPYLSRATMGRETVYGRYARTAAEAEQSLRQRLRDGGYAV